MLKTFSISMIVVILSYTSFGQSALLNIPYFETVPVIDGIPEHDDPDLPWLDFPVTVKSDDLNPDAVVRYRMAYNAEFLYLLIETNSDSIVCRDRAYQNGDGFHMVVARPDQGKATGEFYVLRFSPADPSKRTPARKNVWYYNIGLSSRPLSAATKFASAPSDGKSYFELQLSWNDIYPYHPLFSDSIGINLCFVKAIGTSQKNYYFLRYDDRMQSELSLRDYIPVRFEPASGKALTGSFARLERNNIQTGKDLKIKTVSVAHSSTPVSYWFSVRSADNYSYLDLRKEKMLQEGMNRDEFILPAGILPPGGYKVFWRCSDQSEGEIPLSVMPVIDYAAESAELNTLRAKLTAGDLNTLHFMLRNIMEQYKQLMPYETGGEVREQYLDYRHLLGRISDEPTLLSNKTGITRRAFRSNADSTLQPYSIRLPEDFDRSRKYPLFVMLHGSGSDDRDILKNRLTGNGFIAIAPYGRGTSNCYTTDGAEKDVKEAIDDAIRNYPVDTSRIIIAGFSMGGYGALRIAYEYPELFRGIVLFSGHPNLASRWIGEGNPDFLDPDCLKVISNIPIFAYHSRNDLNCPYSLTEQMVGKLRVSGAEVEFITTEEGGHGIIDEANMEKYLEWLEGVVKSEE